MISRCCHQRLQFEPAANALALAAGEQINSTQKSTLTKAS
jgi:hypothetical protein